MFVNKNCHCANKVTHSLMRSMRTLYPFMAYSFSHTTFPMTVGGATVRSRIRVVSPLTVTEDPVIKITIYKFYKYS